MAQTDGERLAVLEVEVRAISAAQTEIKADLRSLTQIASKGNGALSAAFKAGNFLGWVAFFGLGIYNILHPK